MFNMNIRNPNKRLKTHSYQNFSLVHTLNWLQLYSWLHSWMCGRYDDEHTEERDEQHESENRQCTFESPLVHHLSYHACSHTQMAPKTGKKEVLPVLGPKSREVSKVQTTG